ncbi:MAG: GNAT family N-acetyltransferase [Sphingobacteriales bacterium]|nr:MAG: GNAT family N-acetyltransferase [Sphingobacteriales bacterium]
MHLSLKGMNEILPGIQHADLIIRKVLNSELQQLAELSRTTFFDTYHAYNTPEDMQLYLETNLNDETIFKEWKNSENLFYIAWFGTIPVGYCKLALHTQPDHVCFEHALEIARLYVVKNYKNLGIGKRFIEMAKQVALQNACSLLWLIAWKQNHPAISFYEKQGFTIAGEQQFILGKDVQFDWVMKATLSNNL